MNGRRGLTLIEMVVALGIIAFALLTMVGVYISGIKLLKRGEDMTQATEVGRRVLESLRESGFDNIPASTNLFDGRVPDPVDVTLNFPPPPYPSDNKYQVVVTTETIQTNLKSVTAKVYYDDDSHVILQTYFKP